MRRQKHVSDSLDAQQATGNRSFEIGLGTAALGNLFTSISDEEAAEVIDAACNCGVRWFDSAPLYGSGLAERRLGSALRRHGTAGLRISTKAGRVLAPAANAKIDAHFVDPLPFTPVFDYSSAGIRRSLEESLVRLGTSFVDMLFLHDIDRLHHGSRHRQMVELALREAIPAMCRLREEGLIGGIGLGINQWEVGFELMAEYDFDSVLLAGRYTLLDQSALTSGFLDSCARKAVPVYLAGVFNSGVLAGGNTYEYAPASAAIVEKCMAMTTVCRKLDTHVARVALQLAIRHPAVHAVLVGPRSIGEVKELYRWASEPLNEEVWSALKSAGLLETDVPTRPRT